MNAHFTILLPAFLAGCLILRAAAAPVMLSGNENKIQLTSGTPTLVKNAQPDNLTILDFATFPPKLAQIDNLPNTVIGPPSNITITPDGSLALVANSIKVDPNDPSKWLPHDEIHLIDLKTTPPRRIGAVRAGQQPSGMSITPDGKLALVANRADGTISILKIDGHNVRESSRVKVCEPAESLSDVAISPDGRLALATAQKSSYLAVLKIEGESLSPTGQKISVYGQPYRCVITPDSELGLTAGQGFGNGVDPDLVTVVDLKSKPIQTIDYIQIGSGPESIEISPDGRLLAAVVMNGSNLARTNANHTTAGGLELLVRKGKTFERKKTIRTGAIPEGVAFTSDGKHLVVQCHPARELWIYKVRGTSVSGDPLRLKVPGMPSSLRASP